MALWLTCSIRAGSALTRLRQRNAVRAKGEVSMFDKDKFDKAVNAEKKAIRKNVDKILLKKLDVRVVAMLSGCLVKTPKPRPDGSVGGKWAILQMDDGVGRGEGSAFAKVWEKAAALDLEQKVDQLVMVCGEVSHRVMYAKEDVKKEHPQVGDLSFTVKEAYPLEHALPLVSKGLRIKMQYADPEIRAKVNRIRDAIAKGAGEIDMVQNVRALQEGNYNLVYDEIADMAAQCREHGVISKVILETCYLADAEKVKTCELAVKAGVDFVKTSTGFGTAGATAADIALMRKTVGPTMGVKAAGGIRDLQATFDMLRAGATRIGTSAGVKIVDELRALGR